VPAERFMAGSAVFFELLGMVDWALFPIVLRKFFFETFYWVHIKRLRTMSEVVYTCEVCISQLRTLV
jgi:hypothetical protein